MRLHSLGFRTDLIFSRFWGDVEDLGDALAIRNVKSPTHYFGNLLVFDRPPRPGDRTGWEARFAETVGATPGVEHVLLGWDDPQGTPGDVAEFLAAGYHLEENVVMAAPALHPPARPAEGAELRPLRDDDADWASALDNQVASRSEGYEEAPYRAFKTSQMADYRAMVRAGRGHWYGAFVDGRVVCDLGVFAEGDLARYQSVGTHPDFRRRGLCGSLVHFAGGHAQAHFGAGTLVIVADDHYVAKNVYRSVGFESVERQALLLRRPTPQPS